MTNFSGCGGRATGRNASPRHRRIRIFCDYGVEPVWGDYGLDDLPITPELRERMLAWARLYESKDSGVLIRQWEHAAALGAEGRAIVRELKRQLPDWTVVYLDEAALEREWMRGKTMRWIRELAARRRGIVSRKAQLRWQLRRHGRQRYRGHFEYEIKGRAE